MNTKLNPDRFPSKQGDTSEIYRGELPLISACLGLSMIAMSPPQFHRWGIEALELIKQELMLPDGRLYGEEAKPGERPSHVAFNWSVGVMLEALNAAAETDRSYRPLLAQYIDATQVYWNPSGPVAGFDVLPMPKSKDRYYDDNEWMVIALVSSAKVLKSDKPLKLAEKAFAYVMSGKDSKLGGGIYWRESDKASKNTCSNGPAAAAAVALFEATKDRSYLQTAEELYHWTKSHLRDPADGLYWDNVALNGHIQNWKFSYNTGLMLRSASELYRLTKRDEYAEDAREMQSASFKHWIDSNGSFKDDTKFMHLLLENWLLAFKDVPGVIDPSEHIATGLTRMHDISKDALGHYGNRCDDVPKAGPYTPFKLIDQAAAARAFLKAAEALR